MILGEIIVNNVDKVRLEIHLPLYFPKIVAPLRIVGFSLTSESKMSKLKLSPIQDFRGEGEIIVNNVEKVRLEILRVTSLYPLATLLSEDCSTSYWGSSEGKERSL